MRKQGLLILDPAHGIDVPGKRSPDGKFLEYKFSRMIIARVLIELSNFSLPVEMASPFLPFLKEPGLTKRVLEYNMLVQKHDAIDRNIMISFHNDAITSPPRWQNKANTVKVFTSKGFDTSDELATILCESLENDIPELNYSWAYWQDEPGHADPDWEANFTILSGNKTVKPLYNAMLLELCMMDNKEGVRWLTSERNQIRVARCVASAIVKMFKHMGSISTIKNPGNNRG